MDGPVTMKNARLFVITIAFFLVSFPAISNAGSWNGWIYQNPYPTSNNLFDVTFITPLKGWITGKYGTILYTEDGGENWEAQESGTEEDVLRVCFVNEKMGWAAARNGTIIHTQDGGKKWVKQFNIKALPTKIFFINEKEGWITGASPRGVVYHTRNSGKTWRKMETGISRAISSVYFNNSQTGWILAGEDVYRTTDGGKTWKKSTLPMSVPPSPPSLRGFPGGVRKDEGLGLDWWFGDVVFVNERQGWAAAFHWVFHTGDGGKTWAVQRDTGNLSVGHISFRDVKNGCVSGGSIYCTEDEGKTWQEMLGISAGENKELGGISFTGQADGWVVGNGGRIMKTGDGGRSWRLASELNKCGRVPFFINKKIGWLYDPRDPDICRTHNGGQTWMKQDAGIKIMDIFFLSDSLGWAVGRQEEGGTPDKPDKTYSVIKQTKDGGKTWKTQFIEKIEVGTKKGSIYNVNFINRDNGWAIGNPSLLLRTTDGGKHWKHIWSGDVEYSLSRLQFIDSKMGWITGTQITDYWTGIVLHTEDGGKHWKLQRRLRDVWFGDLDFKDNTSGRIIGETEYGEVGVLLHTKDGGKTWSKKEFENIGHVYLAFLDKQQGVIYSLNGFILVTTDGGKTWNKRRVPLKKYPWHFSEVFEKGRS